MPTPIIDQATFSALRDAAGADFVNELASTFCEEAPGLLAELRAALGAKSAERFRRAAHSIKSNGLTFGADTLAAMARELELGGLVADTAGLDALEREFDRTAAALKELCHG
jgi:HPt (histidine-containing phosphotransfer) domain-containing protein